MFRSLRGAWLGLVLAVVLAPSASAQTPSGGVTATDANAVAASVPNVSTTKSVALTRNQTKRVQRKVKVRADGKLGTGTRRAIKRYQQRRSLSRTGRPNLETLRKMRLSFADSIERKLVAAAAPARTAPGAADPAGPALTDAVTLTSAVAAVRTRIGSSYRSGATGPSSFDCSGLMVWGFKQVGVDLPRTSFEQYRLGTPVAKADIQAGDLVFFNSAGPGASHVGIATGPTKVLSATSSGVMEHRLDDSYWGARYVGARRIA